MHTGSAPFKMQGAYHRSAIYPPQTVQEIIEAARVRGIRVILEFDTPGHVGALGLSHPGELNIFVINKLNFSLILIVTLHYRNSDKM